MMKRNLIVFVVIALLCFVGSAYAAIHVKCNEDRITISEATLAGDLAGAEGLIVVFDSCLYDRDTTKAEMEPDKYASKNVITFTAAGPKNEYSHMLADDAYFAEEERRYFEDLEIRRMNNYDGMSFGIRSWLSSSVYYENVFQSEDFQERWKKAGQPGEIRISDFYGYYPMLIEGIMGTLENDKGFSWFNYTSIAEGPWLGGAVPLSAEEASKALKTCADFLKIPVLPNDTWELVYDLNSSRWTRVGDSHYCPNFYKVWTDRTMWFTFDVTADDGSIVDTSEIPGGFGIYRMPIYTAEQNGATAELFAVDRIDIFYPLDPTQKVVRLGLTGNGEDLILVYCSDGVIRVRVIGSETGETKADIPLGNESDFAEAGSGYVTFAGEDYYVFQVVRTDKEADDSETFVLGKKPDGEWGIRMHTTGYASRQWRDGTAAYDGKRLALVEYDDRTLRIIVYSEEGVLYQGTITASLFLTNDEHEWGSISGVKCYWK